jgi:hypothetical protein
VARGRKVVTMSNEFEDCVCQKCREAYSLGENCEPSRFCNACVHGEYEHVVRELAMVRRELTFRDSAIDALRRSVVNGTALSDELRTQLNDVTELDAFGRRLGTRLDIPCELPGIDEDHIHFVLMPIGPVSRRAAVKYLKEQEPSAERESHE